MNNKEIEKLKKKISKYDNIVSYFKWRDDYDELFAPLSGLFGGLGTIIFAALGSAFHWAFFIGAGLSALTTTIGLIDFTSFWNNLVLSIYGPKLEKAQYELEALTKEKSKELHHTVVSNETIIDVKNEKTVIIKARNNKTSKLIKRILKEHNINAIDDNNQDDNTIFYN